MKHLFFILLIVSGINATASSQNNKLIPEALRLKTAFDQLQNDPKSVELQKNYIDLFPDNSVIFKKVFAAPELDQLYDHYPQCIYKLKDVWDNYPELVGSKLIQLSIGLKKWDADAIGLVQKLTVDYANTHMDVFLNKVKQLDEQGKNTLITFLADVENHNAYKRYQDLIDNLKNKHESDLAISFEKARELRKSLKSH
jgi:hypothetical protein